jgi:hypothetical protein
MFKSVVSKLENNRICSNIFTDSKEYSLYNEIKRIVPEYFDKSGRQVVFVGNKNELLARETEIMNSVGHRKRFSSVDIAADSALAQLSDEELEARIDDTFTSLSLLADAAAKKKIRALIVSGSPGTGKTYEVMRAVQNEEKANKKFYFKVVKGTISPIALYMELYEARDGVLVLDDCDEAFTENESLQLLKAATESTKKRLVSYRKMSQALADYEIPNQFIFNGCVIVLTNTNLEEARKAKQDHYSAIVSRSHYLNAVLATDREKLIRIRSVITKSNILANFLDKKFHAEIIAFIDKYHNCFRELSIRTVVKIAELRAAFDENWEIIARGTLLCR